MNPKTSWIPQLIAIASSNFHLKGYVPFSERFGEPEWLEFLSDCDTCLDAESKVHEYALYFERGR